MNTLATHDSFSLTVYHVERSPYRSLRLKGNTHPHWALSYVVTGAGETISRGITLPLRAGDVMVHPPGVPYSEIAPGPGVHEWLLLEAQSAPHIDIFRLSPVFPVVSLGVFQAAWSENFAGLLDTWQKPDIASPIARRWHILGLTARLIAIVIEAWERNGSPLRPAPLLTDEDRFTPVLRYMETHLAERLTRERLASLVCLHPGYFDRVFRRTYGIPPSQMLRAMRLRRAQELLLTERTVEEIATLCGFASPSHFSRTFVQAFGQSPGAFRQGLLAAKNRYPGLTT